MCVQPARKKHTCDSRTTLLHREITSGLGQTREICKDRAKTYFQRAGRYTNKSYTKKKKWLTTDHGWFVVADLDRDPPPPHSIPPFDDYSFLFSLHVSWVVPIFALDSVSQVRLIPHSISTLLRVLGKFFVKLILLHDTDTHTEMIG